MVESGCITLKEKKPKEKTLPEKGREEREKIRAGIEERIRVMVNGLPGKMASKVAEHVVRDNNLELIPFALTGADISECSYCTSNTGPIELIKLHERDSKIEEVISKYFPFISVDFTQPNAVNENGYFYCRNNLPFVMGTTGGDRKSLEDRVKISDISAVIAPNMAKQIVAFQAMMQYAAENFPDVFRGYTLEIVESHQKGKADTSGTARAMVGYFNELGIPFKPEQIQMIREPDDQLDMGIPEEHLGGHGWHTYTLKSRNKTVLFQFTHNVNGRDIYAAGTLDAVVYLDKKVKEGSKGRVYSMIDVLKGD